MSELQDLRAKAQAKPEDAVETAKRLLPRPQRETPTAPPAPPPPPAAPPVSATPQIPPPKPAAQTPVQTPVVQKLAEKLAELKSVVQPARPKPAATPQASPASTPPAAHAKPLLPPPQTTSLPPTPPEKLEKPADKTPQGAQPANAGAKAPQGQARGIGERLRSMFARKAPPDSQEERTRQALKALQAKRPRRRKLQRRSLQQYLEKAGYDISAEYVKRTIFRVVLGAFALLTAIILGVAVYYGAHASNTLLFILSVWTAVFTGVLLFTYGALYFFLDYKIYRRTREVEAVLPDFLQLASSNIAAGMPIDRALWYAIRPNFGVLAKEMEDVAKATMTGEDLETSLTRFADRYDSTMLKRSISILIEGLHAGGEMADLLNKIALNIDEIRIMKKEMSASVTTYAIFITFASVIIAPFLFGLSTELLTIIVKITSTLQVGGSSTFFTLTKPDPASVQNFKVFSTFMIIFSTVFSASIVSVIRRGNVIEGIKTIPVYSAIALLVYYASTLLLHNVFAGLI